MPQKRELKRKNSEGVLADQRSSLEQWVDYFGSADSEYIPKELKYWILREVVKLSEYEKTEKQNETGKFPARSKGTIKQFPDINYEALSYVVDAVDKKLKGIGLEFEHDIQENERKEFLKFLDKEDFAKLYAWANELYNTIPEHLLPITEGEWRKYEQNSDSSELVKTIRGKGTGWCTAGENTARTQLAGGDFYVFYSLDDDRKPTIPRIAIRMEGHEKIAEDPRGVAYKQNLDPYMIETLEEKLKEFGSVGEVYKKKSGDVKMLTVLEKKVKANQELNKSELIFLYEVDSQITYFGYQKDPRIKELRAKRNLEEDVGIIFEYQEEQIACNIDEVNEDTKIYIGAWNPEIHQKLPSSITHLYESFPEKKIFRRTVELTTKTPEEYTRKLLAEGHRTYGYAQDILNKIKPLKQNETADLISFSVEQLGFPNGATLRQIYDKAKSFGLELCPPQAGPELRLYYKDQPMGEWLRIAMEPITDRGDSPQLFVVARDEDGSWLDNNNGILDNKWNGYGRFVFRSRKN